MASPFRSILFSFFNLYNVLLTYIHYSLIIRLLLGMTAPNLNIFGTFYCSQDSSTPKNKMIVERNRRNRSEKVKWDDNTSYNRNGSRNLNSRFIWTNVPSWFFKSFPLRCHSKSILTYHLTYLVQWENCHSTHLKIEKKHETLVWMEYYEVIW